MILRPDVWKRFFIILSLVTLCHPALAQSKKAEPVKTDAAHVLVKPGACIKKVVSTVNHAITTNATELRLSYSGIDDVCFDSIVLALRKNKSIMRLYLSHNALDDDSAPLFALLLNVNDTIQGIDISNNRFTQSGIASLADAMIDNDRLHFLYLRDMQLTESSIVSIARLLKHGKTLHHLDLSMNRLSQNSLLRLAEAIPENNQIQTLGLFQSGLTGKGLALKSLLTKLPNLQWLDLGGNDFTHGDMQAISDSMQHHKHIRGLNLSFNRLGDEDIILIAPWLSQAQELLRFVVHHNDITDSGAQVLANSLLNSPSIHTIAINNNKLTSASVPSYMSLMKKVPTLVNLFVFDNLIDEDSYTKLASTTKSIDRLTVIAHKDENNQLVVIEKHEKTI